MKAFLTFIIVVTLTLGLSWLITCGILGGICWCFGWTFKWSTATGIWLISMLLSGIFKSSSK